LASIKPKEFKLQFDLHNLKLNVPAASEYALHGVARRLSTLGSVEIHRVLMTAEQR
jgi:hypothetical protein